MIIAVILQLILAALFVVITPILLLPDVSLPGNVSSAIATAGGYIGLIAEVAPATIVSIMAIFALVLIIENTHFGYKLIRWVYQKIPGVS